jgi:hypothetical protein|tara:strand:+ start:58 stop:258 length:201 start_codon:yes stop_codon:yes gene_type:complete
MIEEEHEFIAMVKVTRLYKIPFNSTDKEAHSTAEIVATDGYSYSSEPYQEQNVKVQKVLKKVFVQV